MQNSPADGNLPINLLPFDTDCAPPVSLSARMVRYSRLLQVKFCLTGDISAIAIPPRTANPRRLHELWKTTCFELFFYSRTSGAYHEINLSPSGDWNLYRFDAYRKGMREEPAGDCLQGQVLQTAHDLVVQMKIGLLPFGLVDKVLYVRPCAVLLSRQDSPSYWAISHPGPRPDFHDQRARHFLVSC